VRDHDEVREEVAEVWNRIYGAFQSGEKRKSALSLSLFSSVGLLPKADRICGKIATLQEPNKRYQTWD